MKISTVLLSAGVIGALTIAGLSSTAFAWHPDGQITKKVQNVTTGGALSEADTAGTAVAAKPGDTLKYVIEVRNDGKPDSKNYNDLAKIVMKDTLPAGIVLASNPAQRDITENHDLIKPGKSKVWEYLVKVTATKDGSITNTACFTGDSTVNDNPQKGCNPAIVTVTVPPVTPKPPVVPPTPTPETPVPTPTPEMPTELPKTGLGESILASTVILGALWYTAHRYIVSQREVNKRHL